MSGERLVERDAELAKLRALLDDACRGKGRMVILRGPPGIGKTRLLGELQSLDGDTDVTTFSATGTELERDFPFGCVRQLFEPLILRGGDKERGALLNGDARLAEAVFRAPSARAEPLPDPSYGILHGLYWLTVNLAERSPVLIGLDDAHWADPSSLRFLSFLARRLDGVPALIALAMRPGEPGAEGELLGELARDPSSEVIDLVPLSESAISKLVRGELHDATDRVVALCHEATGGNPFLLLELLRELKPQIEETGDVSPDRIRRLGPARVTEAVASRIIRIGDDAPALAQAISVLGDGTDLRTAAALAGIDRGAAASTADDLALAGVLAPGRPLRFTHPIVRNTVYQQMRAAEQDRSHRRAAALLADSGASVEAVCLHLLATEGAGDAHVVELLRKAARAANARGASDAAIRYLERALAEPPPSVLVPDVLCELGRSAEPQGDPRALDWLGRAVELGGGSPAAMNAAFSLVLALSYTGRSEEALTVAERALAEGAGGDVGERLEEWVIGLAQTSPSTRRSVIERVRRNLDAARSGADMRPGLVAIAAVESALTDGDAELTARLAERAARGLTGDQALEDQAAFYTIGTLALVEEFERADRLLAEVLAFARARANLRTYAAGLAFHAWHQYLRGHIGDVRADAELYPDFPKPTVMDLVLRGAHIQALVAAGALEEAVEIAERTAAAPLDPTLTLYQRFAEGLATLRLSLGDWRGALEATSGVAAWESETGQRNGVWVPWRSQAALAHAALDELDRADQLARQQVSLARRFGAPGPLGRALRTFATVSGGEEGIAALSEAGEVLARSALRLERAQAAVDLGAALRRANEGAAAREPLRQGLELARACGATPLADRALDELVASGARPRREATRDADALTPSERRVAEMAAEGMSNKEIAQALFVTANTVHTHLRHTYRKLGINSRAQLASRLENRG